MSEKSIIVSTSFDFAIRDVQIYKLLTENRKEFVMSKQLLRSGTAVGALVREAQNAESRLDFIHKLGIAQKECDESIYWIELLTKTNYLTENESNELRDLALSLLKMIRSSIITTKNKLQK